MSNTLRSIALMSALSGPALADQEELTAVTLPTEDEPVACIFETASFNGVVIREPAVGHMAADKLFAMEEYFGELPGGDIDMVEIQYSMCGSEGHQVTEYFDRVDVQSFLDDDISLAPGAVQAFTAASDMVAQIPCTDSNREWIYKTTEGPGANVLEPYCGKE